MKKPIHGLTLLITLLCLLALSSCKDDNDGISADIHSPITGYWQIAGTSIETGADINGDGAVEGIAVHDDGTVSEWQYTQATEDPFKLGYKTGTWTIDGNHYVMLLSKGNNKHYTVTVAGNDNEKMYLAYNGKTSVIPFYRLQHLPGDGDSMMEMMAQMKFSGIQMSDLAGYWELANNDVPMATATASISTNRATSHTLLITAAAITTSSNTNPRKSAPLVASSLSPTMAIPIFSTVSAKMCS